MLYRPLARCCGEGRRSLDYKSIGWRHFKTVQGKLEKATGSRSVKLNVSTRGRPIGVCVEGIRLSPTPDILPRGGSRKL